MLPILTKKETAFVLDAGAKDACSRFAAEIKPKIALGGNRNTQESNADSRFSLEPLLTGTGVFR